MLVGKMQTPCILMEQEIICVYITRTLGLLKAKPLCPWRWFRLLAKFIHQNRSMQCSDSDATVWKQPWVDAGGAVCACCALQPLRAVWAVLGAPLVSTAAQTQGQLQVSCHFGLPGTFVLSYCMVPVKRCIQSYLFCSMQNVRGYERNWVFSSWGFSIHLC